MTARFLISLCISQAKKYIQMNYRLQNYPKYRLHNYNVYSFIKNVLETIFSFSSSFVHSFSFLFFIQFMKEREKKDAKKKNKHCKHFDSYDWSIVYNCLQHLKINQKTNVCIDSKMRMGKQNETKTMNNPFYKHRFNKICIKYQAHHTVKYGLQ